MTANELRAKIDHRLPAVCFDPRPSVRVVGERDWFRLTVQGLTDFACVGTYGEWQGEPVIVLRAFRREMDLTYAHEQGHHVWKHGLTESQRAEWTAFAGERRMRFPDPVCWNLEECFAEAFGLLVTGRPVGARIAGKVRELAGLR